MQLVLVFQSVEQPERGAHILARIGDFLSADNSGRFMIALGRCGAEILNGTFQGIAGVGQGKSQCMEIKKTTARPPALFLLSPHSCQVKSLGYPVQRRDTEAGPMLVCNLLPSQIAKSEGEPAVVGIGPPSRNTRDIKREVKAHD